MLVPLRAFFFLLKFLTFGDYRVAVPITISG